MPKKHLVKSVKKHSTKKVRLKRAVRSSLLTVAGRHATGKRINRHQTSHGFLLFIVLCVGVILYSSIGSLHAMAVTASGDVAISLQVNGAPPSIGAAVISPPSNSQTTSSTIHLHGTCTKSALVAVYDNGIFAGSTVGTDDGTFDLDIQLATGVNQLQAFNYDGLNQAGPATEPIIITLLTLTQGTVDPIDFETDAALPVPTVIAGSASTLANIIPISTPCYSTAHTLTAATSTRPLLSVPCITRNIFPGEAMTVPVVISGGKAPYALSVDWGDATQDLKTFTSSGAYALTHTYKNPGIDTITFRWTDAGGSANFLQTVATVNGSVAVGTTSDITNTLKKIWLESPVPLYWAVLTLTVGFWIGDVFNHLAKQPKRRRAAV